MTRQLEPEWDDSTRNLVEGLDWYAAEVCPGCKLHPTVLNDPEGHPFTFDERVCPICAGQARYSRVLDERDEEHAKQHQNRPASEPRPTDGRHLSMRAMTPAEVEAKKTKGGPDGKPSRQR